MTERTITSSDSAPTTVAHGYALGGKSRIWWSVKTFTAITSYTQSLYLYDGGSANPDWVQIQETVETGKTTTDANFYDIPANGGATPRFTRYQIRISALVGTSLILAHEAAEGGI